MKKLLFIFAAAVLAVGCTDKPEYDAPGAGTAQALTLVYDTAQITSDPDTQVVQTLNFVDDFYRVNGKYVKLSMYLANDGVFYLTTSDMTSKQEEALSGLLLECEIAKVEGDFSNPAQINPKSVSDDDFDWQGDLPDAEEEQEPEAEQPETVTVYKSATDARPAYVVRYKDNNDVVQFGFVFTVQSVVLTETLVEEVIPHPFETVTETVPYYNNSVTLLYKAFDKNGNWLN